MGLRRVYRAEADCHVRVDGARLISAPWGLAGGLPGGKGGFEFGPGVAPLNHGAGALKRGQILAVITPGACGYGPPAARDPKAVARDVAEGTIGAEAARATYGAAAE
jgi:N-methylhydantoinase B